MSVLKSQRQETGFEVLTNFVALRKEFTDLLYRNFGYKRKYATSTNPDGSPKTKTEVEIEQDNLTKLYLEHMWFIERQKEKFFNMLMDLTRYITSANSIFPNYVFECDQKREYQNMAIGHCYSLWQELQYLCEFTHIDINKLKNVSDLIDKEIKLLKGWRQSGNRLRKTLEKKTGATA